MMSRNRIHPACTALIKAFAPGCPTMLRSWSSKPQRASVGEGGRATQYAELVTLLFDLPTEDAVDCARRLVGSAPSMAHVALGGKVVRELTAALHAEYRTLSVDALLVKA